MRQRKKKEGTDSDAVESVKRGRAASPPPGAEAETKRARGRPAEQQEPSSSKSEKVADLPKEHVRKYAKAPKKKEAARPKTASESSNDDAKSETDRGAASASSAQVDSSETKSENVEDFLPKKRARVPKAKQTPAANSGPLPEDDDEVQVVGNVKSLSSAPVKSGQSISKTSSEDPSGDSLPKKRARATKTKTAVAGSDVSHKDEVHQDTELHVGGTSESISFALATVKPGQSNSDMSKIPSEDSNRDAVPKKKARVPKAKQTEEATSDPSPTEDVLDDIELEPGNNSEPHASVQVSAQSSSKTSDEATNAVQKKARVAKNLKKPSKNDVINKVSEKSGLNFDTGKKKTTEPHGELEAGGSEENESVPGSAAVGADGGDTQRNVRQQLSKKGKNVSVIDPSASKAQTSKPVKEQGEPSRILPKRAVRGSKVNYVDSPEGKLPKPTVKQVPKSSDQVIKGKSKKANSESSQLDEDTTEAQPLSNGNPKIAIEHCKS